MSEIVAAIEGLEKILKSLPTTKKGIDKEVQKATKKYFSNNPEARKNLTNLKYHEIRRGVYSVLAQFYSSKGEEIKGELKELISWINSNSPKSKTILKIEREYLIN
jgi:endonuclease III